MASMLVTSGLMKILMKFNHIYIPGNVASAKNSKQKTAHGIINSKAALRYKSNLYPVYVAKRKEFTQMIQGMDAPYLIGFHFIRETRGRFDFNNMTQMVQDMMVYANWIPDDNVRIMVPFPLQVNGRFCSLSKEMAGVIISLVDVQSNHIINDDRLLDF